MRRRPKSRRRPGSTAQKIRYAVVGLGHIAQAAVLPAFEHAGENSELAALVSGDAVKLKALGRRYGISRLYSYEEYEKCLRSGEVDAVYICLPNSLHRDYSVRAAQAGVHVLCEKPMAVSSNDCLAMINAAQRGGVRLMVAYRLHFEDANMEAVAIVHSGRIGTPRLLSSIFSLQVRDGDIRLARRLGGGTLLDLGIYCVNAARYLFRAEPEEVFAFTRGGEDPRFSEVEEMASAVMTFPESRLATFTASFGAADLSSYRIVATKGDLLCEPAFDYETDLKHVLTIGGKTKERTFGARDQFAPELVYFSDCILNRVEPEPSGLEGLADVRVIEALYRSAGEGRPVRLDPFDKEKRPGPGQEMRRPAVREPALVRTERPSR